MVSQKPLTPEMQREVDAIKFVPKPKFVPTPNTMDVDGLVPIQKMHGGHDGEDTRDHFKGHGMTMADSSYEGNAYDAAYSMAHANKDTADNFKGSTMWMADETDIGNSFDAVYSLAHTAKDTADHFGVGMTMAPEEAAEAERVARLSAFAEAKAVAAASGFVEKKTMGKVAPPLRRPRWLPH